MKFLQSSLMALITTVAIIFATPAHAEYEVDADFYQKQVLTLQEEKELHCLAQNIYYEAGSESYDGKLAVAQVTVNRAESGKFPDTVCGVVKQKSVLQGRTVCQFSWFCSAKARIKLPFNSEMYQESLRAARQVLIDGLELVKLKDALYFHAGHVNPNWGKVRVAKIGNHVFYRDHRLVK